MEKISKFLVFVSLFNEYEVVLVVEKVVELLVKYNLFVVDLG